VLKTVETLKEDGKKKATTISALEAEVKKAREECRELNNKIPSTSPAPNAPTSTIAAQ